MARILTFSDLPEPQVIAEQPGQRIIPPAITIPPVPMTSTAIATLPCIHSPPIVSPRMLLLLLLLVVFYALFFQLVTQLLLLLVLLCLHQLIITTTSTFTPTSARAGTPTPHATMLLLTGLTTAAVTSITSQKLTVLETPRWPCPVIVTHAAILHAGVASMLISRRMVLVTGGLI
jgi:hypothetical protein